MTTLLVLIILINNLIGKELTDKDEDIKISTNNVSEDFDIDQEIKEYCTVIENFSIYL